MYFRVITIFPDMFAPFWEHGMIRRAIDRKQISVAADNLRNFAQGRHRVTDDRPYGGGCGMVMKPEPLADAIRFAKKKIPFAKTVLLSPQGRPFCQQMAWELATAKGLILVCGRYEGVDERICNDLIEDEISIGDYVMTGGELAAMVLIDTVTRLIPGVLGGAESAQEDSFSDDLLEYAHYTRPHDFEGDTVPGVLVSGHHRQVADWRRESALIRTFLKRKDLLQKRSLSTEEIEILKKWCTDIENIIRAQSVRGIDSLSGGQ